MNSKLKKHFDFENKKILMFFLLFLGFSLSIYILFNKLGFYPFENWDEAFYAQTTKEMLQTKDIIALHWNYNTWLEKPPMYIWISSLSSLIFGLSEFAVRLPSAVSALMIVVLTTIYSYKKYALIPALFTFFTLILNNVFVWRARSGNIDLFGSLLVLLTFFLLIGKNKHKYIFLGLLFFCLYLTKASLVVFPLFAFVLNELIYERKKIKKNLKEYIKLFSIFIGLSCIWLLLGYLQVGPVFVINYIFHADQGVAEFSKFNSSYIHYAYYSLQRRFFFLFLIGIFFAIKNFKNQHNFLLIIYSCFLLLTLSFTTRNNNWYLIPSMPFWSIVIGIAVYSILNLLKRNKLIYLGTFSIILLISSYLFYRTFTINIIPILNSSSTIEQTQSAKKIKSISDQSDTVVRLDPFIPTTLYYTDRKTLAYSPDTTTHGYWISEKDLRAGVKNKTVQWLTGTNSDIDQFESKFDKNQFEKIKVNETESILRVK